MWPDNETTDDLVVSAQNIPQFLNANPFSVSDLWIA
jgi:hypothetical protein